VVSSEERDYITKIPSLVGWDAIGSGRGKNPGHSGENLVTIVTRATFGVCVLCFFFVPEPGTAVNLFLTKFIRMSS
jgi:hypothetical protein